ncbi:MAG: bifunctional (p)ppGpp synthetase/guanosine-3',5'-bis(diphosphate) 3'-pyrophosphohydrolase [Bacteroidales bacterium]|nr:bifunctional (p)ppGpp synthetase/guanosine-3',5'-bis(diphosphate) 3'-pyrophosphohydrolase [Bacteroidales bacterium]MCB8998477.1 bifunctional (p)ppGpp synthetase/guanosine-3',5'-bis(diphosphate) 3'-pyrophosphohydrolase [Bacteroidales bacterium]MCB9012918.1 bifunctional (p)ppGpp synthetase/guanosine-3',5'-bis(diphosphate) 3'-pyrophosphohydrolase [Bacteroidales bacterium]
MTVIEKTEQELIQSQFEDLLNNCTMCNSEADKELITKAFNFASEAHRGMRRKSGEPYIVHPIAVAKIVNLEIGLGVKSIIAALLHDVVEDTDYTLEDIESNFGPKITLLIDGLTKISGVFDNKSSLQAENFRKMLLTLSNDVRVIIIKLADRLHNMRTLDSLPRHKQIKIAGETIYLFAPLAHRLGLYAIKTELEDLSLKYRYPKIYDEIVAKIRDNEEKRVNLINKFSMPIIDKLVKNGIQFQLSGRPKSIYSVWNKMQQKNVEFEEIFDLLAIRIVFTPIAGIPEKTQCWNIYSLITDIYPPRPDRIRDWVSTPKANGYEALHVTVMGPYGKWIEVQIRSHRMDEIAERGFAAHWKYKEPGADDKELDKWLKKIRELLENPSSDALEFLDEFKMNLFASEIFVFTPKGQIKTLPAGATALDFAYEIHTKIGNTAIGAKINHHLTALSHQLQSGDQVEIITSENQKVKRELLDYVITVKAKSAIKAALKAETKNRIEVGKKLLEEKLQEYKLQPSSRIFKKLLPAYEAGSKDELYSKIGSGLVTLDDLKKILKKNTKSKWIKYWDLSLGSAFSKGKEDPEPAPKGTFVVREELDDDEKNYTLAKCCNPIPGDEVIGYKDEFDTVTIHQARCNEAVRLASQQGNRVIPVKWTKHKILAYLVTIALNGYDRFGVYNNITTVISKELSVNIRTINLHGHDGIFEGTIELYVHNTLDLNNLVMNLMKIKGVESVHRVESKE